MLVQNMMVDMWTDEVKYRFPDNPEKAVDRLDAIDLDEMQNNLIEETAHSLKIALEQFDNLEENLDDFFGEESY